MLYNIIFIKSFNITCTKDVPKARHPHKHDSAFVRYVETHTLPVSKTRYPINPSQATKSRSVGHTTSNPNPACRRHDIRTCTIVQVLGTKMCKQHTHAEGTTVHVQGTRMCKQHIRVEDTASY